MAPEGKIRFRCKDYMILYIYSTTQVHVNNSGKIQDCVCKYLFLSDPIDWSPQSVASDLFHLCCLCIVISDISKQCDHEEQILLFLTNACNFHFSVILHYTDMPKWPTDKSITIVYYCIGLNLLI